MPEVAIEIGNRVFEVACQEGEEQYLQSAAALLNREASALVEQIGRMPEPRMLLMAGLMLADKTAGISEELARAETALAEANARIDALEGAPAPEPQRVEVPVIPAAVKDSMAEIAARAEALATQIEEQGAE